MGSVIDFKTKTMIKPKIAPSVDGLFLVGIDVGYSGCKIYSQNKVACFPCYAKEVDNDLFTKEHEDSDIMYQDLVTRKIWAVGETAVGMMSSRDTNDNAVSMYSRARFADPMFLVIMRVGLALGLMKNDYGDCKGKEIFVQTGLPAAYGTDTSDIKDAFCQKHEFAVKVGNNGWQKFNLTLDEDHVNVISQPKGTMYSSIINDQGEFIENANKVMRSRSLIFDAGFNTLDIVHNNNGIMDNNSITYDDMGMKEIFMRTADIIEKKYKERVEIPYMQFILRTGLMYGYDRKTKSTMEIEIAPILNDCNYEVCMRAINKLRSMYNELLDIDYLIVTGGTGEAWWYFIKDEFKGLRTLTVLPGNANSDLPFTFSNVRGYYFFLYRSRRAANKKR